jgi:hypothetical protein
LIRRRQRYRFSYVHIGGAEPNDRRHNRIRDIRCGHDHKTHDTAVALRDGDDLREELTLVRGRTGFILAVRLADIGADQPDGHDDDIAIARCLKRSNQMRQRVRVADRNQHVPRARVDLTQ